MNESPREIPRTLRAATYNIHSSVGTDGRRDPARIARVIRSIDPDLIGLQEVDSGYWNRQGEETVGLLEQETGLNAVTGPTLRRRDSHYGNALLTRLPVTAIRRFDLSVPGYEPRGAIDVSLKPPGLRLRAMVTHFGLKKAERARQTRELLEILEDDGSDLTILFGDFNEWTLFGPTRRRFNRKLGRHPAKPTFPSRFPFLRLDRIWCRPARALENIRVEKSPPAREASDHLPLVAEISLEER
jgi:endonuclease/exonuclease/phosphatase family metal-dependent hydrolase